MGGCCWLCGAGLCPTYRWTAAPVATVRSGWVPPRPGVQPPRGSAGRRSLGFHTATSCSGSRRVGTAAADSRRFSLFALCTARACIASSVYNIMDPSCPEKHLDPKIFRLFPVRTYPTARLCFIFIPSPSSSSSSSYISRHCLGESFRFSSLSLNANLRLLFPCQPLFEPSLVIPVQSSSASVSPSISSRISDPLFNVSHHAPQ